MVQVDHEINISHAIGPFPGPAVERSLSFCVSVHEIGREVLPQGVSKKTVYTGKWKVFLHISVLEMQ